MPNFSDSEIRQFQGVLAGTDAASKFTYLEQIPVSPPDGAVGNLISQGRGFLKDTSPRRNAIEFTKVKLDNAGERICYLTLKRASIAKEGALTFDCATADSTPVLARANAAPVWWLPWESRHMVKIKIAAQATAVQDSAGVALPNPDLFFTAAVSGCSVFVRGGNVTPSIYHGGINGKLVDGGGKLLVRGVFNKKQFKKLGGSTPAFWRQVLSGMDYDPARGDTALLKPTAGANKFNRANDPVSEVNTTHYTSDKGTNTTRNSRAFESFLKKQAKARGRQIDVVAPWGAVFGLRNGANWSFYLQQNVLVVYTKLSGGPPISDCLVLAVTRFSPGQGEARPPKLDKRDFARIEYALR